MAKFKNRLDDMMGDTDSQEQRIKQRVHESMQQPAKKRSWHIPIVATAMLALSGFLFFTINPLDSMTTSNGPVTPYDPLDDMVAISALHKKKQLSTIDYEELATLPLLGSLSNLHYVDYEPFSLPNDAAVYHTVIERQQQLYESTVYEPGHIVRTLTNTNSHLPTFYDAYYEIIAVPGDRVVLQNGELKINNQKLDSALMQHYEQNGNTILGSYEQVLNAREYFILNRFPAQKTPQAGTITPVHKILGEVVALAKENETATIYFEQEGILNNRPINDYGPEAYLDLYLYDLSFGTGNIAQALTLEDTIFPYPNKEGELLLESAYRNVTYLSDDKVEILYHYGRPGVAEYTFYLSKMPNSTIWKLGSAEE